MLLIFIVGGLTLMMGQHTRSESLFYYFRLEDQAPENHLLARGMEASYVWLEKEFVAVQFGGFVQ
jgi:hypothetical protein